MLNARTLRLPVLALPLLFCGCFVLLFDEWDDECSDDVEDIGDSAAEVAADATSLYTVGTEVAWPWTAYIDKRDQTNLVLDATFNGGARIRIPNAVGVSIAIDGANLYAMVKEWSTSSSQTWWRVEKRDLATGALVAAFDGDGILIVHPTTGADIPLRVRVDATSLYLLGNETVTGSRLLKVDKVTGVADAAFGTGGTVTTDGTFSMDTIAVDATSIYVAGRSNLSAADTGWRIDRLNLSDGLRTGGYTLALSNPTSGGDRPTDIAVDATAMIVVGMAGGDWRIERRLIADGTLDPAFGTSGSVTENPGSGSTGVTSVLISGASFYLGGTHGYDGRWRVEKRAMATGALDPVFGVIGTNPGDWDDELHGLTMGTGTLFAVGQRDVGFRCGDDGDPSQFVFAAHYEAHAP